MIGIKSPQTIAQHLRPISSHGVRCAVANDPERRLIGEIPGEDGVFPPVTPSELLHVPSLEAEHIRIGVRMPAVSPRDVPVGVAYLTADKKVGIEVDAIAMRHLDEKVELPERLLVVLPGPGLEPLPDQVKADKVEAQVLHLGKVGFNAGWVPLVGPLHCRPRWHPVDPDGNETLSVGLEVVSR